jgi:hypothetical protein
MESPCQAAWAVEGNRIRSADFFILETCVSKEPMGVQKLGVKARVRDVERSGDGNLRIR